MFIRGDGASIELTRKEWGPEEEVANYYFACIRASGFETGAEVYAFDPKNEGLPKFFAELANDWRGWDGVRHWSSLEGEFEIDCEHDRLGNISTVARLHKNRYHGVGWTGEIRFEIAAGQLDEIAKELTRFFKN